jgi:shikimate 5-dehydrogenase
LLSFQQLMRAKFSSYIYQPLHFHIFGASVDYSLSPMMHNAAFDALAMDHNYSFKQSHDLRDFNRLVDDSFGGASISLPYKGEILAQLDSTSQAAKAIQAVNTLLPLRVAVGGADVKVDPLCRSHKNRAGPVVGLYGENTDWTAIYTCVSRYLSPANTIQPNSSALIVGAGGMARASVYALLQMGVRNIVLWNRTHSKAIRVAEHFTTLFTEPGSRLFNQASTDLTCRIEAVETLLSPWPEGLAQPTIVVCTIPAHQIGDTPPPEFEIPQQWFQSRTGGVIVEVSNTIQMLEQR